MPARHAAAIRYRISLPVVLFTLAATVSLAGGLLGMLGWAGGDRLDSPGWLAAVSLMLTAGFGFIAYRAATVAKPGREAPEPTGEPAVLRVQNRLGVVFWLFTVVAVVWTVMTARLGVVAVMKLWTGNADSAQAAGLAAVGMRVIVAMFLVAMMLAFVAVPILTLRARGRTHMWLSREGIGYAPPTAADPGFLHWDSVAEVSHADRDARGVVYAHVWTIRATRPMVPIAVEYPAGATPRPRRIRRTIRELAPSVEVPG